MFLKSATVALFLAISSFPAFAGPQYIDGTGYAASGYDVVSYFDLKQSEIGTPQASPLPGKAAFALDYNGAKFAFSSQANLDRFKADPAKYAPQFDGHCAFGVAKGGKVPGNPNLWRIVDGKLYLNIKDTVVSQWEEDIPGNIKAAGGNWTRLEPKAASKAVIPNFTSEAPAE